MKTEKFITADGSHTLFVPQINEHYHSVNGAVQESEHIFIEAGLKQCKKQKINVLEIGFGTGLNAFATFLAKENTAINYTSLELYPIDPNEAILLNFPEQMSLADRPFFENMHFAPWNQEVSMDANFVLHKIQADVTKYIFANKKGYDLVFFDAFSPEKQPEMWSEEVFSCIFAACNSGAILTTYCAKGSVRRLLQQVGFLVERLPGPIGKREILRARKP